MDKGEEAAEEKEWWGWEVDSQEEVARGKPGLKRGFRKKCGGQQTGGDIVLEDVSVACAE